MATVEISEFQIQNCRFSGDTATLKLWWDQEFTNSDDMPVMPSVANPSGFFLSVPCTINTSTHVLTVPAFEVDSSSDGEPNTALLSARFFSANGKAQRYLFQGWSVPASLAPATTYATLQTYNDAPRPTNPPRVFPTFDQVEEMIADAISGGGAPKMTTAIYGIGKLSSAATDVLAPIVLSATEPIYTGTTGVRAIAEFNTLAAAIASIGSTVTTLLIPTNVTTNSATVPSTLTLEFGEAGKLTVNSGQTVTINSKPNLIPGKQYFFGTGSVVFGTNAASDGVDLGWWAASGDTVTAPLANALTSLDNCSGGILNVPAGTWLIGTTVAVPDGVTIRGQGSTYDTSPSVTTFSLDVHDAAFTCENAFRNIAFKNLRILGTGNASDVGILATGASPDTAFGLRIENVIFNGLGIGVDINSTAGSWQLEQININYCYALNCAVGIRCNTINSSISITDMGFDLPASGIGFLATTGVGQLYMNSCKGGGTGTAMVDIQATAIHTSITIESCESEGPTYFFRCALSDLNVGVNLISNVIQNKVRITAACLLNLIGNEYTGTDILEFTGALYFTSIGEPGFETAFADATSAAAIRLYSVNDTTYNIMERGLKVRDHALSAATPIIDSYSDTTSKVFLRLGQSVAGTPTNTYTFTRTASGNTAGWLAITGSQTVANRGLSVNGQLEFASEIATVTTSPANKAVIGLNTSQLLQWNTHGGATKNFVGATTSQTANRLQKATANTVVADSAISDVAGAVSWSGSLSVTGSGAFSTTLSAGATTLGATTVSTLGASGTSSLAAITGTTLVASSSVTATKFVATSGISNFFKGAAATSATALVPTGNVSHVSGTTNITSIDATGITAGTVLTLIFDDVLTFTDGNNLKLAGNFVTTADDTITLAFDGTNFYEICRSVN